MSVSQALDALGPADRAAVEWLLERDEPTVRHRTLTEVLGLPAAAPEVVEARGQIFDGAIVQRLLAGQQADGGFGVSAYSKWSGAHWRLIALVELGVPADGRMHAAFEHELDWLRSPNRLRRPGPVDGRYRRCGSQEGAALAVGVDLGLAGDDRVADIARDLIEWQWPDGGWNCDIKPAASHSSFHESIKPLWALDAYGRATGDPAAGKAADRAAEFFLMHRLFRSERTGEPYPRLLKAHFPTYWHYDFLDGLHVLAQAGRIDDPRTADALDELRAQQLPDGRWRRRKVVAAAGQQWLERRDRRLGPERSKPFRDAQGTTRPEGIWEAGAGRGRYAGRLVTMSNRGIRHAHRGPRRARPCHRCAWRNARTGCFCHARR